MTVEPCDAVRADKPPADTLRANALILRNVFGWQAPGKREITFPERKTKKAGKSRLSFQFEDRLLQRLP
ncbi:hypothetical protein CIT25_02110 [Mesorhizobium mediterraneum]|uniref:Uncharacterized protein n=1 Tax=Mesorhizobium mediterraneum TaxID=43617 RepID=A0AB36RGL6_9HYPH|nr:hypothetical protein CIT25_02110 [Mesorhizobium mediterraneum]